MGTIIIILVSIIGFGALTYRQGKKEGYDQGRIDGYEECKQNFNKIQEFKKNTETYTSMAFDSSTMEELANKDYVIWYSEEAQEGVDECECCCDKLEKVKEYVNTLIDTYTKDYSELMKDYNEGNVQQCVKVEAETVYHNLNKVLNSIKDLLDE